MGIKIIKSWDIDSEFKICHIEKFDESINDLVRKYFAHNYPILRWRDYLNDNESRAVTDLNSKLKSRKRIDIGILKGEKLEIQFS